MIGIQRYLLASCFHRDWHSLRHSHISFIYSTYRYSIGLPYELLTASVQYVIRQNCRRLLSHHARTTNKNAGCVLGWLIARLSYKYRQKGANNKNKQQQKTCMYILSNARQQMRAYSQIAFQFQFIFIPKIAVIFPVHWKCTNAWQ